MALFLSITTHYCYRAGRTLAAIEAVAREIAASGKIETPSH